jgi:branched-chain amino acid transport system substrate-binding protein
MPTPVTADLIGVIGTFNSGCAAIEIPVLNQAPGGGLLLLSPANTVRLLDRAVRR